MLKKYYKTSVVHKKTTTKTLFMYENYKNRGCAQKNTKSKILREKYKKARIEHKKYKKQGFCVLKLARKQGYLG